MSVYVVLKILGLAVVCRYKPGTIKSLHRENTGGIEEER
ncbi:hypothetical protein FIU86_06310 [Roseovarius sp. THAF9]|nr:hypothetical protein FIU86_06310 [Roseovarius sp. THAF9]